MIFQYGTVLLIAFASITPLSDDAAFYYKANCNNDSVFTSVYLEATSDDDDYWYTFDMGLSFDFYFNKDDSPDQSKVKNFVYDVDIYRHYINSNNASGTYHITVNSSDDWYLFELDGLINTLHFSMYHENDTCIFEVYTNNDTSRIGVGSTVVLPTSEEFVSDYGFKINLDFLPLYDVLYDYRATYGGYSDGYTDGYRDGQASGYSDGYNNGYQNGYIDGYNEGSTQDEVAVAIFSGIISVGLIPINFFLACLNFEVFGINIGAFVSALLTIAIVVIITRIIVSGGNGGDK